MHKVKAVAKYKIEDQETPRNKLVQFIIGLYKGSLVLKIFLSSECWKDYLLLLSVSMFLESLLLCLFFINLHLSIHSVISISTTQYLLKHIQITFSANAISSANSLSQVLECAYLSLTIKTLGLFLALNVQLLWKVNSSLIRLPLTRININSKILLLSDVRVSRHTGQLVS